MAAWSAFYPDLLVFVQACPEPLLNQELRRAAQEFFRRTRAWQQWLGPITATGVSRSLTIPLPTDSQLFRVEDATQNDRQVDVIPSRWFPADPAVLADQADGVTSFDRVNLLLARNYDAGTVFRIKASLTCSDAAATLPDDLFAQYSDAILHGAKARLMMQPDKSFTNLDMAPIERAMFMDAIGKVHTQAWRSSTGTVPRLRPRWA